MLKFNHFLPESQVKVLRALARKEGVPLAELIRRAIAEYIDRQRTPAGRGDVRGY